MKELGLLWRLRKDHEEFTAWLAFDDARGHVLVLALNGSELSSATCDEGPLGVMSAAQIRKGDLLERGWTEDEMHEIRVLDTGM
jgi:hypothetical protein